MSGLEDMIGHAEASLGLTGRPNRITRWYAGRNGAAFSRSPWCNMSVTYWANRSGNAASVCFGRDYAYTIWHAQRFRKRGPVARGHRRDPPWGHRLLRLERDEQDRTDRPCRARHGSARWRGLHHRGKHPRRVPAARPLCVEHRRLRSTHVRHTVIRGEVSCGCCSRWQERPCPARYPHPSARQRRHPRQAASALPEQGAAKRSARSTETSAPRRQQR